MDEPSRAAIEAQTVAAYLASPEAAIALGAAMAVSYSSLFPTTRSKRMALSETYWRNQAAAILAAWIAGCHTEPA